MSMQLLESALPLFTYSIAMLSLPQRTSKFLSIQSSFGEILLFRGEKVVLRIPGVGGKANRYLYLISGW